jgi:hypothetical protein
MDRNIRLVQHLNLSKDNRIIGYSKDHKVITQAYEISQIQLTRHAVVKLPDSLGFKMLQRRSAEGTNQRFYNL